MAYESLLQQQQNTGSLILRFLTNLKKVGQEKLTFDLCESRLDLLESYWNKFQERHDQLVIQKDYAGSEYSKGDLFSTVEDAFINHRAVLRRLKRDLSLPQKKTKTDAPGNSAVAGRLPQLSIPTFSGDYLQWETFRDLFVSVVHEAPDLTNAARFQYLKSSLTGEAAKVISGVPITDANYEGVWTTLVERYDDKRILMSHYFNKLLSLKPMTTESASELKALLFAAMELRRALQNLGRPVEHWDDWFVHIIVQRLDSSIHKDWEASLGAQRQIPALNQLSDFLTARSRALDAVAAPRSISSVPRTPLSFRKPHLRTHCTSTQPTTSSNSCPLCARKHYIGYCQGFKRKSPSQRREVISALKLCCNCLKGHSVTTCPSTLRCRRCDSNHHTLLHGEEEAAVSRPTVSACSQAAVSLPKRPILLATAIVQVTADRGRSAKVRALLDQGSEVTFVSEDLAQRLRLQRRKVQLPVVGISQSPCGTAKAMVKIRLSSAQEASPSMVTTAFVLPRLVKAFRPREITCRTWPHLSGLKLSDDDYQVPAPIDLVIGADLYGSILREGLIQGPPGAPVAQNTIFGWVLSGRVEDSSSSSIHSSDVSSLHCSIDTSLFEELRKFWEIEEIIQPTPMNADEQYCEEHFQRTHTRTADGRFVVRLPRRPNVALGDSRFMALRSFQRNEARRLKDQALNQAYRAFIQEYEQLDHMTLIDNPVPSSSSFYLPHHAVWKAEGSSKKIRVVFNASARSSSGNSLNDVLLPGPKLQRNLAEVLLRWRKHEVVFTADIIKMFRQIWVHPEDQSLQRILWRDAPEQELQEFQLKTVTYGTTCAPFLAIRCLQQLATEESHSFPEAAEVVRQQMYVDDVLAGADDVESATKLKNQLQALLMAGGFQLAKWSSNAPEITETDNHIQYLSDGTVKTLGLHWHPDTDTFRFHVRLESLNPLTKRKILSSIAKLFDPLGWLSPVLIRAKLFLQDLWILKSDWDATLPDDWEKHWRDYYSSLELLQEIRIPRWIRFRPSSHWELHRFCDASQSAYAAAVYIRIRDPNGESFSASLLTAKTKVAPVKVISLPRLELCGAVLLARLLRQTQEVFQNPSKIYAWTDSQVVLCWLRAHPSRWKCFVANRTSEIHRLIPNANWNHVPSSENAADPASRGVTVQSLLSHDLWWQGPSWLTQTESTWPKSVEIGPCPASREEETLRSHALHALTTNLPSDDESFSLQSKYSSLQRLVRITSWILRFSSNSRKPRNERTSGPLTTIELNRSRLLWTKINQREHFQSEIQCLALNKPLIKGSPLFRLHPFLDSHGFLRVGGRLDNSPLCFEEKHPLILPAQSAFTKLLIRDAHEKTLHGGPLLTLSYLGTLYWILRGRNLARKIIHECLPCFRQTARGESQLMGQLPAARVTPSRPFLKTGVDYAGPIMIRVSKGRGQKAYKGYIALFVCLSTKALHLEAVSDLTSDAFLAAFRRFTSRRGIPSDLYSDQATTFRGADRELHTLFNRASQTSPTLATLLANDGTQWHYIPPRSPHFGGIWEAGVRSVKHHLRRVIGETTLTFEELSTVLTEIEACLNSRPLTPVSSSPDDFSALTPGHFLIGAALKSVPSPSLLGSNPNHLTRWKLLQNMREHFWKRWSREYLQGLRQLTKWADRKGNVQVGDMVLLLEENLPPSKWQLGRISAVHPGPDNLVRVVNVRTSSGEYVRSISKIAKLPFSQVEDFP